MNNHLLAEVSNVALNDDFILTISSEDDIESQDLEEIDIPINGRSGQSGGATEPHRKRKFSQIDGASSKSRSPKKTSNKSTGTSSLQSTHSRDNDQEDSASGESDEDSGIDDGAFDPDFDFAIGQESSIHNNFYSQDTWGAYDPHQVRTKNDKARVEVDNIINKRKRQRMDESHHLENGPNHSENGLQNKTHKRPKRDVNGLVEIDENGESLAEDGFSMDARTNHLEPAEESEDEEGLKSAGDRFNSAKSRQQHRDVDDDGDDIAAPMPHPDDEVDDESDENTDDEMRKRQAAFFEPDSSATGAEAQQGQLTSFQNFSLSRPILKGLSTLGFNTPTPIQAKTIPVALQGKDVVGGAVTGSGKTAAFLIPILERLLYRPKKVPTTRVAILMPTRELAVQCYNVGSKLASFTDVSYALIVGGLSLREQEQTLKKRPDIIVATPGRFIDHMRNSASFAVENIEILVLDEADRMLEDGFADELNEVLTTIPKSRQTMLFSATMTENVDQLIRAGLNRPVRLMVDQKQKTVSGLTQEFIKMRNGKQEVDENRRLAYLLHLCTSIYTSKTIIFFPRKALAHRVKVLFALQGIQAAELHGSMSQDQRLSSIASFHDGLSTHLLATDLASRGLDIPRVETVLNFTVPTTTTTYLHRVGRTARAGQSGVSCTLFAPAVREKSSSTSSERALLRPIIRLARKQEANIRTRSFPQDKIDSIVATISSLNDEIESVLLEEKTEKLLQQTDRDIQKGENLVKYEAEIQSRPKRTWFQSEKDKKASSNLGKGERTGASSLTATTAKTAPKVEKQRKKLSNNERKRLEDSENRNGGRNPGWKKGKNSSVQHGKPTKNRKKVSNRKQRRTV